MLTYTFACNRRELSRLKRIHQLLVEFRLWTVEETMRREIIDKCCYNVLVRMPIWNEKLMKTFRFIVMLQMPWQRDKTYLRFKTLSRYCELKIKIKITAIWIKWFQNIVWLSRFVGEWTNSNGNQKPSFSE